MADTSTDGLVTIKLVELPVGIHAQASEHTDELMREFTFIRAQSVDPEGTTVPAKLLDLVDEVTGQFAGFTAGSQAELDGAVAEGKDSIDLEYVVPPEVAAACIRLGQLLDEADEYCREGEVLLTLATPDDLVAYRRWFLEEFVRQAGGEAPLPWSAYRG